VLLVGALITALLYVGSAGEGYSPLNHFISELGQNGQSRLAPLFNAGVVIGGLGLGLVVMVLSQHVSGRYRHALVLAGAVAGASGGMVGIFPMDTHAVHRLISGIFFCTGWIVVAVFSTWLWRQPRHRFARWLVLPGTISIAASLAFLVVYSTYNPPDRDAQIVARSPVWSVPLLEWASLLGLLTWLICVSAVMVRRSRWPGSEL
jgi:hypothetical membrane protein